MASIGIAILSFIFTNIDDLLILIILLSTGRIPSRSIIFGQYLGVFFIVGVSWFSGFVGTFLFPQSWIAFLGVAPILLGVKKLYDLFTGKKAVELTSSSLAPFEARVQTNTLLVAAITLANGGDNVAVYAPLFAQSNREGVVILITTYFIMTSVWLLIAFALTSHKKLGIHLKRYGYPSLPWVMIGLGVYTLI